MELEHFIPSPEGSIYKRNDPQDLRLGDLNYSNNSTLQKSDFVLSGYCDDEGIRLNGGRPGASLAPNVIRSFLTKMTPNKKQNFPTFYDIGNIKDTYCLKDKHDYIEKTATFFLKNNKKWISIGGGHDFAYPDVAAFLNCFGDQNPLVINFDAHLDVRPLDKGLTSGTPFYRIQSSYKDFQLLQIGIQKNCNSPNHIDWCKSKGGKILFLDDILNEPNPKVLLTQFIMDELTVNRPVFVSLDIDVFASHHAMGCSQSWPIGLEVYDFVFVFEKILSKGNIRGLGIYEVSPPLDLDNRSSKLAAQIIYRYLQYE